MPQSKYAPALTSDSYFRSVKKLIQMGKKCRIPWEKWYKQSIRNREFIIDKNIYEMFLLIIRPVWT